MEKYNNAERQLDHYRMQATKISRIVPQKVIIEFCKFVTRMVTFLFYLFSDNMCSDMPPNLLMNTRLFDTDCD